MEKSVQLESFENWVRKRRMPSSVPHSSRRAEVVRLMLKNSQVEADGSLVPGAHFPVRADLMRQASKPNASVAARERYNFLCAAREAWLKLYGEEVSRAAPKSALPAQTPKPTIQSSVQRV